MNYKPLPMATYSKKHHWYQQIESPMDYAARMLAKAIKEEVDKEMIEALKNGHGSYGEEYKDV